MARDALLTGEQIRIEGGVARDLALFGERIELSGEVGRDVGGRGHHLALTPSARVGGALDVFLPEREALEVAAGAVVAGGTHVELLEPGGRTLWSRYRETSLYVWTAVGFVASFLIGLCVYALAPSWFAARIETGRDFFVALGLGSACTVLAPLALLGIALTIVGIPLALIGLAIWASALYFGSVLVAALIGRSLVKPRGEGLREFGISLAVGLLLVGVLHNLPFVGVAAGWLVALVGVGLLASHLQTLWSRWRRTAT